MATAKKTAAKKTAAKKSVAKAPAKKAATTKAAAKKSTSGTWSAQEKAAMKQAAAEKKRTKAGKNGEQDVLDAIAAMDGSDKAIAEGLHALVKKIAPELEPRTWYGFPAYALDGKVLLFWQFAGKFGSRYGHIGFNDTAQLDDGTMWPTAYAITRWTKANEAEVKKLVLRAVGR
jgi:uncharacterized protein YdhG (YjbR/CyaY superfamily)